MSGKSKAGGAGNNKDKTIPFGQKYAESDNFSAIFKEGMTLVEATASYLDGDGRRDAKDLEPPVSLAYATESMRLTTRLMQIASWLLIRRAVNDGEITPQQAYDDKNKVNLNPVQVEKVVEGYDELPERLKALIDESLSLNRRIIYIDQLLHKEQEQPGEEGENPLGDQMARLQAVYGRSGPTEIS